MQTQESSLSLTLKTRTQDLHTRAERHPFQGAMVSGRATRDAYADYLGQLLAIHAVLDPMLQSLAQKPGVIATVFKPYHVRVAALIEDLRTMEASAKPAVPLPATERFCVWLKAEFLSGSDRLLGVLYVLEGATNGGVFISKAVRKGLNLPEGRGTMYLDPHGPLQRERWAAFKTDLDASGANHGQTLEGAEMTFRVLCDIFDEMTPAAAVTTRPEAAARPV